MCGIKMPQRNNNGEMAIDVARMRLADDISNVMQRYTNKVKEIEIRMHFNSLIFPKEGMCFLVFLCWFVGVVREHCTHNLTPLYHRI